MSCNCVGDMNEQMKPHNRKLAIEAAITMHDGKSLCESVVVIGSVVIEKGKKTKAVSGRAKFCPFCGKEYDFHRLVREAVEKKKAVPSVAFL